VDVASGIPLQGEVRQDVVTIVEGWKDLDALFAHFRPPHADIPGEGQGSGPRPLCAGARTRVIAGPSGLPRARRSQSPI